MAESVEVSTDIGAAPETVWALVSDLTQMGRFSPENEGVEWLGGATGPKVGASFKGANRREHKTWTTHGVITELAPSRTLAFKINAGPFKVAEWRYELEATEGGCHVTESMVDERNGLAKYIGKLATGVKDRASHNRDTMARTLEQLKAVAESPNPAS
jgi:uncharacterized protein YndB with AHSA1/START domain